MGLRDTGRVEITLIQRAPLVIVRFDWTSDAAGNAVRNGIEGVRGTLLFADSSHADSGAAGTLDFELQTELGVDVLEGLTGALAVNSNPRTILKTVEIASIQARPMIALGGPHTFSLDRSENTATSGVFELWVHPQFYWDWAGRG